MSCNYVCLYYIMFGWTVNMITIYLLAQCARSIFVLLQQQCSGVLLSYPLPGEYQPVNSIHNNIDDGDMPSSWSIISPIEVIIITASLCRIADSQCYSDLLKLQIIHFLIGCVIVKLTYCSNGTYCTSIYMYMQESPHQYM